MSLTSNMRHRPTERMGFNKAYLMEHSPDFMDQSKAECYIPTRHEVYHLPAERLLPILENWLNNAPAALSISKAQKKALIFLLKSRADRVVFDELLSQLQ